MAMNGVAVGELACGQRNNKYERLKGQKYNGRTFKTEKCIQKGKRSFFLSCEVGGKGMIHKEHVTMSASVTLERRSDRERDV